MKRSVMTPQQVFNRVSAPNIQRSTFDRSHALKTTFDAGYIVPIFVDEALPGDTFKLNASLFGRLATPIKPIMDNIMIDVHFFSVPIRLVWENWKRFNGEQDDPDDSTNFIMPTINSGPVGYEEGTLEDYMGIPTRVPDLEHRADFIRAYALIWNEWYRDQNLQDSVVVPKGDGPDANRIALLPRGKRKDYFTGALPFAQKADPVSVPIATSAPVRGIGINTSDAGKPRRGSTNVIESSGSTVNYSDAYYMSDTVQSSKSYFNVDSHTVDGTLSPNIFTDLSEATAVTINQLRESFQIQKLFERDARGGTRYTEVIYSHFNVISPDARLQRPEYLGGGTSYLNVNPIAQNSNSESGATPQGNLAAMGTFSSNGKGFVKSFTEHEIILGFVSARADLTYQQGLDRMWSRSTRFDFYWPSFSHLGEQAILNKEIYAQGSSIVDSSNNIIDDQVFGYQERYAEYRYKPSKITGQFRSSSPTTLDVWHLSQDFSALPALNPAFIQENPPIDRIVAVPSEPDFLLDCWFDLKCTRPMPVFAVPGLIDHF